MTQPTVRVRTQWLLADHAATRQEQPGHPAAGTFVHNLCRRTELLRICHRRLTVAARLGTDRSRSSN